MRIVGFGIIGCGMIARFHAGALADCAGARLVGVADSVPERARNFAREVRAQAFDSIGALLDAPDIDAVCICTPSGIHAELGIMAARRGKHIVVEKPLAITMEQADALKEACDQAGTRCCVISQKRFKQGPRALKEALDRGALGRPLSCRLTMLYHRAPAYYAEGGWRGTWALDGGGALMNQGIHGVDLMRWLMGPVATIAARSATLVHDIEVEDTLSAVLSFKSGALGVMQAATSMHTGEPLLLSIQGTRGSATLIEDRIVEWHVDGVPKPAESLLSEARDAGSNDPGSIDPAGHAMQLSEFIESLNAGRDPYVGLMDGYEAMRIVVAAYSSSREDRFITL